MLLVSKSIDFFKSNLLLCISVAMCHEVQAEVPKLTDRADIQTYQFEVDASYQQQTRLEKYIALAKFLF